MKVKTIWPDKIKLAETKTTEIKKGLPKVVKGQDFYWIIPKEQVHDYANALAAIADLFKSKLSGQVLVAGNVKVPAGLEPVAAESQSGLIKKLEQLYAERKEPRGLIFDYHHEKVNVHAYLREIYLQQNLHLFRHLPVLVLDYCGDDSLMVEPIKILAVNGSPRKEGSTASLLCQEIERYWSGPYYKNNFFHLDHIVECLACGGHQKNCQPDCLINDQMQDLLPRVKEADVLLLGSPVYMDLPTARTIAFLSRLTGQTKHNRRAYIGKYAAVLSPAWCSGTKSVISSLNNALEMIGFTIQGRSSREYVQLWPDNKTRGGVPHGFYWPS